MAYSAVPTVVTGDSWSAANHNTYLRDNLAALWPFTAAGDIAYASSATALARLAMGLGYQSIRVNSGATALEYTYPGMTLITEHLCSADEASIEFTNIPQVFRNLRIVAMARGTYATFVLTGFLQFNADTGANYDNQIMLDYGTTVKTQSTYGDSKMSVLLCCGATSLAGSAGLAVIDIPDYHGAWKKQSISETSFKYGESANGIESHKYRGYWRNTNAITSIKFFFQNGNFAAGSVMSLYGLA